MVKLSIKKDISHSTPLLEKAGLRFWRKNNPYRGFYNIAVVIVAILIYRFPELRGYIICRRLKYRSLKPEPLNYSLAYCAFPLSALYYAMGNWKKMVLVQFFSVSSTSLIYFLFLYVSFVFNAWNQLTYEKHPMSVVISLTADKNINEIQRTEMV